MVEKVYRPYTKAILVAIALLLIVAFVIGGVVTKFLFEAATASTIQISYQILYLMLGVISLAFPIGLIICSFGYGLIKEIVFSKDGMILKRRFRPIIIQKITDLKVHETGKKEVSLTVVGSTPEGKTIRKTIARTGNVGKRWEEFKKDLQKIKSK